MIKIVFVLFVLLHGLIHLLGFVKAFNFAEVNQLTQNIPKLLGILWLITSVLFVFTLIAFLIDKNWWWMISVSAVILSQFLIVTSWQDAKFGTILNIIILLIIIPSACRYFIEQDFRNIVIQNFNNNNDLSTEILTDADLVHLPLQVQNYIRYTSSIGKPKVKNFKAEFIGGIRSKPSDEFMMLNSTQYNFIKKPSRLFYITSQKMGIPVIGLHLYQYEKAIFKIKLLGLFTVVDAEGEKMDRGETVTLFNDMCFMAPATLIDKRIKWEPINDLSVKANFTNGNITIQAILQFNEKWELINFISNDRYETNGKEYKNYPWSTPVIAYTNVNGYRLPSEAKLIYTHPEGEFIYGKFLLKEIKYNQEDNEEN